MSFWQCSMNKKYLKHVFVCFWLPQIHQLISNNELPWPGLEGICDIQQNDVKSTGYLQKKGQEPRSPGDKVVLAHFVLVELENTIMYGCLRKKGEYLLDQLNIPLLVYTLNLLKNRQNHDLNIDRRTCKHCFNIMRIILNE